MLCALWEICPFINVFMCHIEALWLNLRTRYASTFEFPFEMKWLKIQFWIFDGPIQQIKRLLHFMNENKCMYVQARFKSSWLWNDKAFSWKPGTLLFIIILQSPFIPRSEIELPSQRTFRRFYNARWTPLLGLLVKSAHYLFHN